MAQTSYGDIMDILYAKRDAALADQKKATDLGDALIFRHRVEALNEVIRAAHVKIELDGLTPDDEPRRYEDPYWDTDAAHDSYVLASAGWGTDEDYGFGGYGGYDDF